MAIQHLRSAVADSRPIAGNLADGQLALNYESSSPGVYFKDDNGVLVKVGPVHVGSTAPNLFPTGSAGNAVGEQWLDTTGGTYVFKVWDGSAWRSEAGEFVNISGDTMTGALGVIAGSAAAPGVFVSGDTDTGIYSPGADQLAISTNGAGRLFVDASGNVGVGSSSPRSKVDVSGNLFLTGGNQIQISNSAGSTGLQFIGSDSAESYVGTMGAHALVFRTASSERMRLDSSGRLGLGTSSPSGLFDARGFSYLSGAQIRDSSHIAKGYVQGDARGFLLATDGSTNIVFDVNGTERIRLDTSGRLGIGTTAPDAKLYINNGAYSENIVKIVGLDTGKTLNFGIDAGTSYITAASETSANNRLSFRVSSLGTESEAMRIDDSGRLLVGTSSTSADTRIVAQGNSSGAGSSGRIDIDIDFPTPSNNDYLGMLVFGDNTQSTGAWLGAQRDGGTWSGSSKPSRLVFSTTADGASSPTERMRITNNGESSIFAADSTLNVRTATTSSGADVLMVRNGASSTATGTIRMSVKGDGDLENTNNSYGALSDIKLKENIVDASSQWDDLKTIRVRHYNFKEETGAGTHKQIGLIAQEVELVSPGLVSESPDRDDDGNDLGTVTKSVNYSVLYMKAVKALQEAMERIEQLEAEMAEVKAQLQAS